MTRLGAVLSVLAFCGITGGAGAFEGFTGEPGSHLEATRTALSLVFKAPSSQPVFVKALPLYGITTYRWTPYRPADLLSDASRDIDSYWFGSAAPHAQTKDFSYRKELSGEKLRAIEAGALLDYFRLFNTRLDRVRSLYLEGRDRDATYTLGLLFHSYQDLWAHRGITNVMHKSLLRYRGLDVDRDPERVSEMRKRFAAWLGDLPSLLGSASYARFSAYIAGGEPLEVPTYRERGKILGKWRDIFIQGPIYKYLVRAKERSLGFVGAIEWDTGTLDLLLYSSVDLERAASCKTGEELALFLESRGYRF